MSVKINVRSILVNVTLIDNINNTIARKLLYMYCITCTNNYPWFYLYQIKLSYIWMDTGMFPGSRRWRWSLTLGQPWKDRIWTRVRANAHWRWTSLLCSAWRCPASDAHGVGCSAIITLCSQLYRQTMNKLCTIQTKARFPKGLLFVYAGVSMGWPPMIWPLS